MDESAIENTDDADADVRAYFRRRRETDALHAIARSSCAPPGDSDSDSSSSAVVRMLVVSRDDDEADDDDVMGVKGTTRTVVAE